MEILQSNYVILYCIILQIIRQRIGQTYGRITKITVTDKVMTIVLITCNNTQSYCAIREAIYISGELIITGTKITFTTIAELE